MNLFVVFLGLLACIREAECTDLGYVEYIAQNYTGSVINIQPGDNWTFSVIEHQSPAGIFEIVNGSYITVITGQIIDYETATEHVLVVKITNTTDYSFTATATISVIPLHYSQPSVCIDLIPGTFAPNIVFDSYFQGLPLDSVERGAEISKQGQSSWISFYQGTNYDSLRLNKNILPSTKPRKLTVTITAVESIGIPSTATQTVVMCVNGYCSCNDLLSGATGFTMSIVLSCASVLLLKF